MQQAAGTGLLGLAAAGGQQGGLRVMARAAFYYQAVRLNVFIYSRDAKLQRFFAHRAVAA
jgi:hypothetical protein